MTQLSNISRRRRSAQLDGSADYAAKRKELLQIAAQLFKQNGFQATRIVDIASAAGLDRATAYYYVGSKEELFRTMIEEVLEGVYAEAERLSSDPGLSWLERLHAIFVSLMISYERNYPATFVYIQERMHQIQTEKTEWAQGIIVKARAFDQMLLTFISKAIEDGDLRRDIAPRIVENALFGMLNWTHRWFVPGRGLTGEQLAEDFWSIFIGGMKPTTASHS
ncbi:MAG: TetR/AcrR family transcriptional regulator [Sphingomicrobium sp.]